MKCQPPDGQMDRQSETNIPPPKQLCCAMGIIILEGMTKTQVEWTSVLSPTLLQVAINSFYIHIVGHQESL